jgi:plasmid stabilization system protein ParE
MAAASRAPVWSPAALADLAAIWTHYAKVAGRLTADKTMRDVGAACRTLEARPFAGRARDEVRRGLRSIAAGPLVVFYRLGRREGAEVLEILRVLDRRKDFEEMLIGEGERR